MELRTTQVNRQNPHLKLKERMRCFLMKEPQSATPGPKTRICASGDRLRHILKTHRCQHPTDCTQTSQMPPGRASGAPLLSSHHQSTGKTHRNRVKFSGERRWYFNGYSGRTSHERKMINVTSKIRPTFLVSMVWSHTESHRRTVVVTILTGNEWSPF